MKKLLVILLIACACSDDEPGTDQGCLTGIPKTGSQDRVLIKCSTKQQYLAGSNTGAGGTASWNSYTSHKWEPCSDCK